MTPTLLDDDDRAERRCRTPVVDVARRLEAILLIVDEPQSLVSLADRRRRARARGAPGDRGTRRGLRRLDRRPAPRLRAARGRRRLAPVRARGARRPRHGVRQLAGAVAAVAGGARDARRDRLQAARDPRPGRVDPRRERRLGRADAARARAHHRGVHGCRDRRHPLRHDRRAPGEPRDQLARRAAAHLAAARRRRGRLRRGAAR